LGWDDCGFGKVVTADGVFDTVGYFDPQNLPEWFASRPEEYLLPYSNTPDNGVCDTDDAIGFVLYNHESTWGWTDEDNVPMNFSCINFSPNNQTFLCTDYFFMQSIFTVEAGDIQVLAFGLSLEYYNRNLTGAGSISERTANAHEYYHDTRALELLEVGIAYFGWSCAADTYGAECRACECGEAICEEGILGFGTCSCSEGSFGVDCTPCDCNNGTCADTIDGDGSCTCPELTYGADCAGVCNCLNGGSCADGASGNGMCTCDDGFTGDDCSIVMTTEATEATEGTDGNQTGIATDSSPDPTEGTSEPTEETGSMATSLLVGSFITLVLSL